MKSKSGVVSTYKLTKYYSYMILILLFLLPYRIAAQEISGRIVSDVDGAPLAEIDLDLYNEARINIDSLITGSDNTDPNGYYSLAGFPAGNYIIKADPSISTGFVKEYYEECFSKSEAAFISIDAGEIVTIDFSLAPGTTIEGTITTLSGMPIEGVDLDILTFPDFTSYSMVTARTDTSGNYIIGNLPVGRYIVKANPDPDMGQPFAIMYYSEAITKSNALPVEMYSSQEPVTGINLFLSPGASIEGHISDQDENPIPDIDIDVFDLAGNTVSTVNASSDAEGFYTIGLLPPGSYKVKADPDLSQEQLFYDQYYQYAFSMEAGVPVTISPENTASVSGIDFILEKGAILSGTIISAGDDSPLEGVDLVFNDQDFHKLSYSATTDALGVYETGLLRSGIYYLWADTTIAQGHAGQYYPGGISRSQAQPIVISAGDKLTGYNLVLPVAGAITGEVTNTASQPIGGVKILAYDPNYSLITNIYTWTASDGTYTIGPLPAGNIYLEVKPPEDSFYVQQFYLSESLKEDAQPVAVAADVITFDIHFQLESGGKIGGTVKDGNTGEGISNIDIDIYDAATSAFLPFDAETDANGHYSLGPLPEGTYIVRADPAAAQYYMGCYYSHFNEFEEAIPISVSSFAITPDIDITLAKGGLISGKVTDNSGVPLGEMDLDVYLPDGTWITPGGKTDEQGNYLIGPYLPGEVCVRVDPEAETDLALTYYQSSPSLEASTPVMVISGGIASGIDMMVSLAGKISGQIISSLTGAGVAGIKVRVFRQQDLLELDKLAVTGINGMYVLTNIPVGQFLILADAGSEMILKSVYYQNSLTAEQASMVQVQPNTTGEINITLIPIDGILSVDFNFSSGLTLFRYPLEVPQDYTSHDLIKHLGTNDEIGKIQRYNPLTKTYETTTYDQSGIVRGDEFPIVNTEGFFLYLKRDTQTSFFGPAPNSTTSLLKGFNILPLLHTPGEYMSYDFLSHVGSPDQIENVVKFNTNTGFFETTYYYFGRPSGTNFRISDKESYLIHMKIDKVLDTPP